MCVRKVEDAHSFGQVSRIITTTFVVVMIAFNTVFNEHVAAFFVIFGNSDMQTR